jgi:uncharacterized membrane protein YhaH (DUF805 family)
VGSQIDWSTTTLGRLLVGGVDARGGERWRVGTNHAIIGGTKLDRLLTTDGASPRLTWLRRVIFGGPTIRPSCTVLHFIVVVALVAVILPFLIAVQRLHNVGRGEFQSYRDKIWDHELYDFLQSVDFMLSIVIISHLIVGIVAHLLLVFYLLLVLFDLVSL